MGFEPILQSNRQKEKGKRVVLGFFFKEIVIETKDKNGLPVTSVFSHVCLIQFRLWKSHDRVGEQTPKAAHSCWNFLNLNSEFNRHLKKKKKENRKEKLTI